MGRSSATCRRCFGLYLVTGGLAEFVTKTMREDNDVEQPLHYAKFLVHA